MPPRRAKCFAVAALFHAAVLLLLGARALPQETVGVTSYNTRILRTADQYQGNLQILRPAIELLAANVIRLQEIADLAMPNLVFPPAVWSVAIDDNRMEYAAQEARSPRERHLAEREAVLSPMEEFGLLIGPRGDRCVPDPKPDWTSYTRQRIESTKVLRQ